MGRKSKTAGDYLHKRMIRLRCSRCKQTMLVRRNPDIDPPSAATCVTSFCNKCESGGEFDLIHYFDTHGKEVSGDPDTFAAASLRARSGGESR